MLKITKDTRYEMTKEERDRFLNVKCPICGKRTKPYGYEDPLIVPFEIIKTKYRYHYHCTNDITLSRDLSFVTEPGCDSRWTLKLGKEDFMKGEEFFMKQKRRKKKNIFMRCYIRILKKIAGR